MKCSIVSFNCCLSIGPPLRFNGAYARSQRLVDAMYSSISPFDLDIVCLQEFIYERDTVLKQFIHHPYHTTKLETSLFGNNVRLLESGLTIVSKYPILEQDAFVFQGKAYHMEAFMAKAVQYAKIVMHENQIVHIFNTHLQAWTNQKASTIRQQQMHHVSEFIAHKLAAAGCFSPDDESMKFQQPVILVGDFNADAYEHAQMMTELFASTAGMYLVMPENPQFSFDPSTNPLVGTDDFMEYITRFAKNNNNNNSASILPPKQLVDGIALRLQQKHLLLLPPTMNVIPIQTRAPFVVNLNMSTKLPLRVISDHSAVHGQFVFAKQSCVVRLKASQQLNNFCNKWHFGWIFFEIALFLFLFLGLLHVCRSIWPKSHTQKRIAR